MIEFIYYAQLYRDSFAMSAVICTVFIILWFGTCPTEAFEALTRKGAHTPWLITIVMWLYMAVPVSWVALYFYLGA